MSFDKNDVKDGIDKAAEHLKHAADIVSKKSDEASETASAKAKELARKAGDTLIEQGHKLKDAAK